MDNPQTLLVLPCYAIAAGLLVLLRAPPLVTALCAAPLVLLAPGYAMMLALGIPGRSDLPGRRFVLSIALSMATTALGGLVVNALAPLTTASWTVWLVGFTCVCSFVAFLRATEHLSFSSVPRAARRYAALAPRTLRWQPLALALLVILLLSGAVTLTELNSRSTYDKPVTQLSLVPAAGSNGRELRLSIGNLSAHAERVILTVIRGRAPGTITSVRVPASHTWTREEAVGKLGLSASLRFPDRRQPFSEVAWSGVGRPPAPVVGASTGRIGKRVRLHKPRAG